MAEKKKSTKQKKPTKRKKPVEKKEKLRNLDNLMYTLVVVVIIISALSVFISSSLLTSLADKTNKLPEPAVIDIIKIEYTGCDECFDVDQVISQIKAENVEVASERTIDFSSEEAQNLITQYSIDKLPTVVITGELAEMSVLQQFGRITQEGGFLLTNQQLPYYDIAKDKILGLVTITTILDSSCEQCIQMDPVIATFKQMGVVVTEENTVEYNSTEGQELIDRFEIKRVPVLIISESITDYQSVRQIWGQLNAVSKEGFYRLHAIVPPYIDLGTGELAGLVDVINLVDSSCTGCYNVTVHKQILRGFGIVIGNETDYDIESTEAQELIEKYNITKIPTIILSPDADLYEALTQVWVQVGSVEDDGWYVFRDGNFMAQNGGYKDLTTGEIINQTINQTGG